MRVGCRVHLLECVFKQLPSHPGFDFLLAILFAMHPGNSYYDYDHHVHVHDWRNNYYLDVIDA